MNNKFCPFDPVEIRRRMAELKPRMTQADLAAALDVTVTSVSRWLNGRSRPHKSYRRKINELLG